MLRQTLSFVIRPMRQRRLQGISLDETLQIATKRNHVAKKQKRKGNAPRVSFGLTI